MTEYESIKLLVLGDMFVGKSSLVDRFMLNIYTQEHFATVGIRHKTKYIVRDDIKYSLQVWDSSGNRNSVNFVKNYCNVVDGIILVYDVSNYTSFINLSFWLKMTTCCPKILIGCKNDLNREVNIEQAQLFANDNNMYFLETSSLNGFMVNESFQLLICKIIEEKFLRPISNSFSDMITISSFSNNSLHQHEEEIEPRCCFF